jgi:hypothetical protein
MHRGNINRKALLLFLLVAFSPLAMKAESLKTQLVGEQLQLVAPDFQFLSAEARQRLHDGITVIYAFRISVSATKNSDALLVLTYHCVFSYDIFEEKYKVTRLEPGYRSASHLSEPAARDLCIRSLEVPAAKLSTISPFWISIECRQETPQPSNSRGDSGSLLDTLVEVFSQRGRQSPPVDTLRGGPFRLDDRSKSK